MKSTKRRILILINVVLFAIVFIWTIPTIGLLISSFREKEDIQSTGWWTVFPHQEYVSTGTEYPIPPEQTRDAPITINNAATGGKDVTALFADWQKGIDVGGGTTLLWSGNLRSGKLLEQRQQWVANTNFTLENYEVVLNGKNYELKRPDGSVTRVQGEDLVGAFLNSVTVTIPATIIPILIAAFAAYGFAWMEFPGRRILFIMVVALLVVPLQISLVPISQDYNALGLNGTYLGIWLAHTGFGLPLAVYLLYNYISNLPKEILESAFIDGASHFTIFFRLVLPLSVPALASFAIFQFLWVWNDFLVSFIFLGITNSEQQVLTYRIYNLVGSRGNDWYLLTAAAFVSMVVPLVVFFALQRYFVRGLMAGSVKG